MNLLYKAINYQKIVTIRHSTAYLQTAKQIITALRAGQLVGRAPIDCQGQGRPRARPPSGARPPAGPGPPRAASEINSRLIRDLVSVDGKDSLSVQTNLKMYFVSAFPVTWLKSQWWFYCVIQLSEFKSLHCTTYMS